MASASLVMASETKQPIFRATMRKPRTSFLKKRSKKFLLRFARFCPFTGQNRAKRSKNFCALSSKSAVVGQFELPLCAHSGNLAERQRCSEAAVHGLVGERPDWVESGRSAYGLRKRLSDVHLMAGPGQTLLGCFRIKMRESGHELASQCEPAPKVRLTAVGFRLGRPRIRD